MQECVCVCVCVMCGLPYGAVPGERDEHARRGTCTPRGLLLMLSMHILFDFCVCYAQNRLAPRKAALRAEEGWLLMASIVFVFCVWYARPSAATSSYTTWPRLASDRSSSSVSPTRFDSSSKVLRAMLEISTA